MNAWPKCACGGVACPNASGDLTRTCIRCGKIVKRSNLTHMPARTYVALQFDVPCAAGSFLVAGTLEGYIDFAMPNGGTYVLSRELAASIARALSDAVEDVRKNCLYDKDALLEKL